VAADAEQLGFDSIWLSDHFTTVEEQPEATVLEAFTCLSALAAVTDRIRLGTWCSAPPTVCRAHGKMLCTLDAISGGRVELGIGAGWKEDEFRGYATDFPIPKSGLRS